MDDVGRVTGSVNIFVATASEVDRVQPEGTIVDGRFSQLRHEVRLDVIIVVNAKDGPAAEARLDVLVRAVQEAIEDNHDLSAGGQNPRLHYLYPERVFNVEVGKAKAARVITLKGRLTD